MQDTTFIYALKCPMTDAIRYVGKANNPAVRLAYHLHSRPQKSCHRVNWISSLLKQGLKPVLEILDEVPEIEWPMWEVAYIQFFRDGGCALVNTTVGGEGGLGKHHSEESREKMRIARTGKTHSEETRAKISASKTGKTHSEETRTRMSVSRMGEKNPNFRKSLSEETRAKLRAARLGKKSSVETRAKLSVAGLGRKSPMFGKKHSAESLEKMGAAHRGKSKFNFFASCPAP